jgi:hypothetical protein
VLRKDKLIWMACRASALILLICSARSYAQINIVVKSSRNCILTLTTGAVSSGKNPGELVATLLDTQFPKIECPDGEVSLPMDISPNGVSYTSPVHSVEALNTSDDSSQRAAADGGNATSTHIGDDSNFQSDQVADETRVLNTFTDIDRKLKERTEIRERIKNLEAVVPSRGYGETSSNQNAIAALTAQLEKKSGQISAQISDVKKLGNLNSALKSRLDELMDRNLRLDHEDSQLEDELTKVTEDRNKTEEERQETNAWLVSGVVTVSVVLAGGFLALLIVFLIRRKALAEEKESDIVGSSNARWNKRWIREHRLLSDMTTFVPYLLVGIAVLSSFVVLLQIATQGSSVVTSIRGATMLGTLGSVFVFFVAVAKWQADLEKKIREAIELDQALSAGKSGDSEK